jgi:signal transduction histidine kinase/FixJ family two-component response regulator
MSVEEELRRRLAELEAQLGESRDVLNAIYNREVDALVVRGPGGEQVFTLEGADHPYRIMVQTMAEGALTLAADGTVLHANAALAHLLERPLTELIGSRFASFVGDEHQQSFAALLRNPSAGQRCDIKLQRASGASVAVRVSASPLHLENLPGMLCLIVFDLTEHERAVALEMQQQAAHYREQFLRERQEELERLNGKLAGANRQVMSLYTELRETARKLKHADEMKTRFLANMSHEFRSPLNSIFALTSLLLSRVDGHLGSEQEKQVTFIRTAADALLQLVNDLLDIAKIEAGKIEVRVGEFTVGDLFMTVRAMLPPQLITPGVELVFEAPEGIPPLVSDESKVTQIVRNFVHNALKFTDRGEVRVGAQFDRENDAVVVSVSDTGIGIATKDHERIFEEFTQLVNPVQSRVKGTGLGLPLCRKLAALLGGRIELQSAPNLGSTFSLRVPKRYLPPADERARPSDVSAESAAQREDPAPAPVRSFSRTTVLIIDDDPAARCVISSLLDCLDCVWREAPNGATGLRLAREIKPELILLDINLPAVSGREVLHLLKGDPEMREIPVAIVTSADLTEVERHRLKREACAIIDKSTLTREKIAELLDRETARHRASEQSSEPGNGDTRCYADDPEKKTEGEGDEESKPETGTDRDEQKESTV